MRNDEYLKRAVEWAEKRASISLKSVSEGYENTKVFTKKSTQEKFQADVSFITEGGVKHYSVVALKVENQKQTAAKWKLLSLLASMKRGQLHLLTPTGHKAFVKKIVNSHNINAIIHSL
ncbi:MAG: hypothetical protein ACJA1H_002840 [Glaciecola sp.]|jgi:hypothetical protein|uniref:hypothetical protein n=1 Tax=Patiriisocius sp. Uisw_047 TaxID=3230969 RepID=UPI0039E87E2B